MTWAQAKSAVVVYRCERCEATLSRQTTEHSDGLCPLCGEPMRIDDLFSDRRDEQRPVPLERRAA
jgi:transcription initiation factor IIE alpha subunit